MERAGDALNRFMRENRAFIKMFGKDINTTRRHN
jgi:hypothetical protein